jgi:hypothetical protein
MAARKSSPVAVFKLTLVTIADSVDCEDVLLLSVVDDVAVGVAVEHAASRITQSNVSEIKIEDLFILFSKLAIDFAQYKFAG